jgi:hypothetical protein
VATASTDRERTVEALHRPAPRWPQAIAAAGERVNERTYLRYFMPELSLVHVV